MHKCSDVTETSFNIIIFNVNSILNKTASGSNENELELKLTYLETRKKKEIGGGCKWRERQITNSWVSFSINQRQINQHRREKKQTCYYSQILLGAITMLLLIFICCYSLIQRSRDEKQTHSLMSHHHDHTGDVCLPVGYLEMQVVIFTCEGQFVTPHCLALEFHRIISHDNQISFSFTYL